MLFEGNCIYCGRPSEKGICDKCLSERNIGRLKNETLFKVEGKVKLSEFKKFILISVARSEVPLLEKHFNQRNLYPEIAGRIWIHAYEKEVVGSFEIQSGEVVDIVRARDVRQITYKSRSKHSVLKWKAIFKSVGVMDGIITTHTLKNLYDAGVEIDKLKIENIKLNLT
ncbi:MAG: hypothetical protein QXI93_02555 [Candidatus Methanomethylicia archaeon]